MGYAFVDYSERLLRNTLFHPAVRAAIAGMGLPAGALVLDAGCGAGAHFGIFAELVPGVRIIGADLTDGHLQAAQAQVNRLGMQGQVEIHKVDLRKPLPYEEGTFDGIWVANVISPKTFAKPSDFVSRLSRLLRPGGVVAIYESYVLRPLILPGYPRLEHLIGLARLLARQAPDELWLPQELPERSTTWLIAAGLEQVRLEVQMLKLEPPLCQDARKYLLEEFLQGAYAEAVRARGKEAGMTPEDFALWERLSDPSGPHCILNEPGYYCLIPILTAYGRRPV